MKKHALALAVAFAIASTTAHAATTDIPTGVTQKLAAGESQDLIVQFDEADIQTDANIERTHLGLAFDTPAITEHKAQRFAERKKAVLSALHSPDFEVLLDYDHLPMMFVRFRTLDALNTWAHNADVTAIFENHAVHTAQSVPWDISLIGQPEVAANGMLGAGTTIAVIDSGVDYTRSAFGYCGAPGNPFDCKVVYFHDFCCSDGQLDANGHGTNVAGIAVETAPESRIAALRVLDAAGNGSDSTVLSAVNWAISNKSLFNIAALNLSLGNKTNYTSPCTGSAYVSPFANAKSAGIVSVVAAGNYSFTNGISSPACTPGAVSVGATDWNDDVAYFSNSAGFLTMLAPGEYICAADTCYSGTSQATPHVAGAAAVLRAAYPNESVQQTVDRMTIYGKPITDSRNGITKPRLDLWEASKPLPMAVQFAPQITLSVGTTPYELIAGDFNGDSHPDLAVANYSSNTVSVFLNYAGRFSGAINTSVANPGGMATGDFNHDGILDLAVRSVNSMVALLGNGDGTFPDRNTASIGTGPEKIKALDINADGILDLVAVNGGSGSISVLLGNPNGTFQPQVSYGVGNTPRNIVSGDFNRDGKMDLAVSNYGSNNVSVLLGNGNGTFGLAVNYPVNAGSLGLDVSDLDHDGKLDLVVANRNSGNISILRGVGDGTFTGNEVYAAGTTLSSVAVADLNQDGFPDIMVTNYGSNTLGILLGNRIKTFQTQTSYPTIATPHGLVVKDFDGNGLPDVAITGVSSNGVALFLNITPTNGVIFADGFESQ
jgi:hypothetical protein